jgi:predicted molibdopterin-dependent oxidoreductase YjgC
VSESDAERLSIGEGDVVEVATPRGSVTAKARISWIRDGVLFLPFHYGYWDEHNTTNHHRAANELTITDWDPVSKQPIFKTAAAQLHRIADGSGPAPAPTTTASQPVSGGVPETVGGPDAGVTESAEGLT